MSREITQKTQMANSSDEETENTAGQNNSSDTAKSLVVTKDNPWSLDVSKEFEEFISGYKKFWSEKNDESKKTDIHEKTNEESSKQTEERQELKENAVPVQEENNEQNSESNSNSVQSNGKLVLDKKNNQLPKKKKKAVKSKTPLKQQKNLSECTTILKPTPLNKETSIVTVRPTSGVWIITTVSEEQEAVEQPVPKKKIRQSENIENLFCDLEDKLMKKANQKAKKIKSKLKKQEKLDKKKQLKVKKSKSKNFDLPLKSFNKVQRADMDVGLLEGGVEENEIPEANNKNGSEPGKNISNNNDPFNDKTMTAEIDPKNFMKVKPKKLGTDFSGHTNMEEDAIDDEIELQQNKIIEEAFGEDDVIAELK